MASAGTAIRSGTTFETMPPARRISAVVRAETGSDSRTSSVPVSRPKYAANAAMVTGAKEAPSVVIASARSRGSAVLATVLSACGAA
ncbi:hypothetical protein GCM10009855_08400 [Gordonia cholesterolivorans]|uniref:Uncharacterized protein n=1 Tax=Gordonia cholesterolivorans TaxID=559625 RepID=A0ABN3H7D8_9ACTN